MTEEQGKPRVAEVRSSEIRILQSDVFEGGERALPPRNGSGVYEEPGRSIPIYHSCDVLVVGGGPSGTAAALSAARAGADVVMLERYNHLGGLSTGGLVVWIDRMTDWEGRQVIRGFAEEVLDRLKPDGGVVGAPPSQWGSRDPVLAKHWGQRISAFHGVVAWSPMIDPEKLKVLSQEMLLEAGVRLVFHGWAALPIVQDGAVKGVIFESKEGRQALMAKVVVDATGDGDVFARAGADYENDIEQGDTHHAVNTAFLLGGVDMNRWLNFRLTQPEDADALLKLGRERCGYFQPPYVSWRNDIALFLGPRQSGLSALNVDDMTEVEIRSHRFMVTHCEFFRQNAPGFEQAYMLQSAPQLGVRHTRRLAGVGRVERSRWGDGFALPDEIGVSPSLTLKLPPVSVPYGALVPRRLDGLVACGRHVSCDPNSHGFMREIPQCWLTGQAAGTAAALAANGNIQPRAVDIAELQGTLRRQGVFLQDRTPAIVDESKIATAS
jgi:hypothetical protein